MKELLLEAENIVIKEGRASIPLLQRKMKIGYALAFEIIEELEKLKIIGCADGSKPRKILLRK